MTSRLKEYFPTIRSRKEVRAEIYSQENLWAQFGSWEKRYQDEFLDFVSGARGVKILYDCFFKEIFNPETVPGRLNELLSLLLGREVKILKMIPNDNSRLGDDSALVIMDIVVELEDGSICNVEIQKLGYAFPGERAACYAADLLLRQYKMVRDLKGKKNFSYRDIKTVYTIVFMENSSGKFSSFPDTYIHHSKQKFDSGLEMNLLEEFLYVPIDIFLRNLHNKGITSKLDAWLTFLGSDDPEDILEIIQRYPEFKELYDHVYYICRNIDEVMGMFSEELRILDKNTERLMIDMMQDEIKEKTRIITEKDNEITEKDKEIARMRELLAKLQEDKEK